MVDKTDMERIGLFKEMPYITINDPYKTPLLSTMNRGDIKGKPILCEGMKSKAATDDGYFTKPFIRIFQGEAESSIVKLRRKWRLNNLSKLVGKPFIPSFFGKGPSGVGSRIGCFDDIISHFSAINKTERPRTKEQRNIYTNPGKKGTGYGYLDVCLNPYPSAGIPTSYDRAKDMYSRKDKEEHKVKLLNRKEFIPSNGYGDYFNPNPYIDLQVHSFKERIKTKVGFVQGKPFIPSSYPKQSGGCKAGTINPYPSTMTAEYRDKELPHIVHDVRNDSGKIYVPPPGSKSCIYESVLHKNVIFRVNNLNSKTIERVMDY